MSTATTDTTTAPPTKLQIARDDAARLHATHAELSGQIREARQRLADTRGEIGREIDLDRLESLHTLARALESQIANLANLLEDVSTRRATAEAAIERLHQDAQRLAQRVAVVLPRQRVDLENELRPIVADSRRIERRLADLATDAKNDRAALVALVGEVEAEHLLSSATKPPSR